MKTKQLIYSIEGLDAEQHYHNYIAFIEDLRSTRDFVPGDSPVVNSVAKQYLQNFHFKNPGTPSEAITINKFKILVHLLICRNHEKENHSLNAAVLKQVIGHQYNLMLRSLWYYGIISKSDFYMPGKSSYTYSINEPYQVKIKQNNNVYVQKSLNKLSNLFHKNEATINKTVPQSNFQKQYKSNLQKLKLPKYDFQNFINQLPYSDRSKVTYYEVLNKLQNKSFNIIEDERERIYTTLTRTPKLLKNFLNIKFQIDINNSHPLLFSYFIIHQYNIPYFIIKELSSVSYSIINHCHNVGKNLCKQLNTNTQDFIKNSGIPSDVIAYIYLTSTGLFWDHFKALPEFQHIPRYLVKVKLFEEVFYSNKLTSWQRDFAKAFQNIYPTVYSHILEFRKESKNKNGEHLAHKMTKLESKIFKKIIQRTWNKGWETVNIHDALVVIDTKKNNTCTVELIKEIIEAVYAEHGMVATTSVDYFSVDQAEEELQVQKDNQQKLAKLKDELHQTALNATNDDLFHQSINLLEGLDNGKIEVMFEKGNPFLIFNN